MTTNTELADAVADRLVERLTPPRAGDLVRARLDGLLERKRAAGRLQSATIDALFPTNAEVK